MGTSAIGGGATPSATTQFFGAIGDLTENQLTVVFAPRRESARTLGGPC